MQIKGGRLSTHMMKDMMTGKGPLPKHSYGRSK